MQYQTTHQNIPYLNHKSISQYVITSYSIHYTKLYEGYFDGWFDTAWVSMAVGGGSVVVADTMNARATKKERAKMVDTMVTDGYTKEDAVQITNILFNSVLQKQTEIADGINKSAFKESRTVGFKGPEGDASKRPGIEKPAPLPETKLFPENTKAVQLAKESGIFEDWGDSMDKAFGKDWYKDGRNNFV